MMWDHSGASNHYHSVLLIIIPPSGDGGSRMLQPHFHEDWNGPEIVSPLDASGWALTVVVSNVTTRDVHWESWKELDLLFKFLQMVRRISLRHGLAFFS
jgi:hypothetical protein